MREKDASHIETIITSPVSLQAQDMSVPIEKCKLAGETSGTKQDAPLIVYLHGGPNGASSTGWSSARFAL
jgi:dipeptidyl aminopeptidase/acylaminoacyl peptidase